MILATTFLPPFISSETENTVMGSFGLSPRTAGWMSPSFANSSVICRHMSAVTSATSFILAPLCLCPVVVLLLEFLHALVYG